MIEEVLEIINKHGLHARPAAQFVKIAGKFKSDIKVIKDGLEVNGKSIMGIMMLAAEPGSEITLLIEGEDEEEAFTALNELISQKFYEDEK
ncbi:MAG: HPr family phosphocarrier protein [Calditrichia bacterium]|nr:HPr family phosphocarrier protein [Calditrichia bacterium]